jgi:hypothetical protein
MKTREIISKICQENELRIIFCKFVGLKMKYVSGKMRSGELLSPHTL